MLSHGRPYLAIPGPSVIPDRVLNAMHRAAPNIYTNDLVDLTATLVRDLKAVARTDHTGVIYIGNGHAAWEAALANVVAAGDKVLVLATGTFAKGWGGMAEGLGALVETIDFGPAATVDPEAVARALQADTDKRIKAVLVVHVDTASGVRNDIPALRAVLDVGGHPALLMVDCIASLACDRFEMDDWGVDVMVAACQKGLMTPPGLGFVFFGPRAAAVRAVMPRVSTYWNWEARANPTNLSKSFNGTAPTHHLFGLRAALDMITEEGGITAVWARHVRIAAAVWAAVDTWATGGPMRANMADRALRSCAITSIRLPGGDAQRLQDWCRDQAGLTLGIGLGQTPEADYFRIGHMGHVNAPMIMGCLGTIEAGMLALGIAHGTGGLSAAARALVTG
jgi:alanine-glyoxylate transaminase / serine-glyoxylate transaminase / serine-pyruvate transaminase